VKLPTNKRSYLQTYEVTYKRMKFRVSSEKGKSFHYKFAFLAKN